ncbi:D-alanine--D-alanine ligase family protein [Yinghuangia soli]|uniref:D-alanine--D-alanine ligase n=1 Tax=Yinghuangia soli TaxID=2908204 RepID=A0AA41Q9U1_9ACTN|nr:D-alanine--D-alanine ligase [Yinghuangia soli]MCF2533876.1 D-alanine--D-alanine ligase [Yinghuangia soli]
MSDLGRVVVLAGGLSHERDVSLRSGRRIADALRAVDVDVEVMDVDGRLLGALAADRPDVVFPALHGAYGEDGAVRDVLELLGIPYVGSRPDACRLAFDKPMAKAALRAAGVRTPDSVALPQDTFRDLGASAVLDAIVARLGLPLFVKPARGGSALGASVARTLEELSTAMVGAFSYGDVALVETYLAGTEVAVSVVDTGSGPEALPAVEIVPDAEVYDYTARYTAGMTEFFVPSRLTPEAAQAAVQAALTAHQVLRLRDVSRTDLIVDADGTPWFLEANVAPGMTETSLLPQAITAAGLDTGVLYRELLHQAATRST